ncbi:MAG: adenylate/guanylate cyclase domain-containing protein [Saprospiraceae bacterium]|nr:adenylate/guanylate cyclase domain-containing protein [Saprospiraceae bacterium]
MSEKKTRRLAAILFADIAGYTALMQRDEQSALAHLQKFRRTLEMQVPAHGGQIVQFYGDGCVATFPSSVNATTCAGIMQERFLQEPRLPVRIGLHMGDVVFGEGNVYGDAVNVTARVESMGVPGSVLLSNSVYDHIKNKPEFALQSLGLFAFKNVEKEMTVYALAQEGFAIPKYKEMQGKGKRVPNNRPWQWVALAAVVVSLISVVLWQQNKLGVSKTGLLSEKIRQERVAAIPFDNNTGVADLDDFGYLVSDLITSGLTEINIKTCSPRTVLQYQHLWGVLPNNPENKVSFSEVTAARYWIEGWFLPEGDSLTIKSSLVDAQSGDVVRNFPEIKGDKNQKELLATLLCQRIMGFWAAREDIEKGKFKAPLYEAYQEYRKIFELEKAGMSFGNHEYDEKFGRSAFEKDPTFYTAVLREMYWQANRRAPRTDTIINLLEPHYYEMTSFEQTFFKLNKALYQRDYDTYGSLLGENYERFPLDPFTIEHYSFTLAFRESRPAKAWEVANQLKLEHLNVSLSYKTMNIIRTITYGLAAGYFEEVTELVNTLPRTTEWLGLYFHLKSKALIRSGQLDALEELSREVEVAEPSFHWYERQYDQATFCNEVAEEFLLLNEPVQAQKWLNKALEWVKKESREPLNLYDSLHLVKTNYLLGNYQDAVHWGEDAYQPGGPSIGNNYLVTLAAAYARLGQKNKAETISQQFLNRPQGPNPDNYYHAARIYAELSDTERAMDILYEREKLYGANALGFAYEYARYDYLIRNLFGNPAFVELVEIRDKRLRD